MRERWNLTVENTASPARLLAEFIDEDEVSHELNTILEKVNDLTLIILDIADSSETGENDSLTRRSR
jgi:hypothetical protein